MRIYSYSMFINDTYITADYIMYGPRCTAPRYCSYHRRCIIPAKIIGNQAVKGPQYTSTIGYMIGSAPYVPKPIDRDPESPMNSGKCVNR